MPQTTQLTTITPEEYGLDSKKVINLLGDLPDIKKERDELAVQYDVILTMDMDDPETQSKARSVRLKIKNNRTKGLEAWHKKAKERSLKEGQFIDAIKRLEVGINILMEDNLEKIEKHAEIQEALRISQLNTERLSQLEKYMDFVPTNTKLGELSVEEYTKIFNGAKLQYEQKLEDDRIAEEQAKEAKRISDLNAIRREQALPYFSFWSDFEKTINFGEQSETDFKNFLSRIKTAKIEYDKQQEENKQKLAKLAEENKKKDAELQAERARIQKIQADKDAEAKAKQLAEEQRKKEAEKLAKAPIKEQLTAWVNSFSLPENKLSNELSKDIEKKFLGFKNWALKEINSL